MSVLRIEDNGLIWRLVCSTSSSLPEYFSPKPIGRVQGKWESMQNEAALVTQQDILVQL